MSSIRSHIESANRISGFLDWNYILPGGPYLSSRTEVSGTSSQSRNGLLGFSIGFFVGSIVSFVIEIAYAIIFTFILVKWLSVDIGAVKSVFPAAQVGLAIVISVGLVLGILGRSIPWALAISLLRIIAVYAQYFAAVIGIFLFERYLLNSSVSFSAEPWLPPFIELGQINLSEALFGLMLGKMASMLPPIFAKK